MLCHPFFWTVLPLAFFHRAASKIASKSATAGRVPSARPASPPDAERKMHPFECVGLLLQWLVASRTITLPGPS